jgi:hypothetical protein
MTPQELDEAVEAVSQEIAEVLLEHDPIVAMLAMMKVISVSLSRHLEDSGVTIQ